MVKKQFHTYADACKSLSVDEETMRQTIAAGGVEAFLHLQSAVAQLKMYSFMGGIEPDSGRNACARWQRATKPFKEAKGSYYLLTGWFRVESDMLQDAALGGGFTESPQVIPPGECDGLSDGDVWELSQEVINEYEGTEWSGEDASIELPSMRSLWFSDDQIQALKVGGTGRVFDSPLKDADPRERTSLLRVIRALDVMTKLPERGAPTVVEKQLQELGFNSPREAAIRKILADARALEPG